ncbi:NAD-dependent dehydratase [Pseudomonas sp. GW456-L14]|uniref:UDP-glucose 4-epimerase family protein n=1 Tax=unclassified Pseudomonas TaxID=196821 RepID=UPI000C87F8A5|nr:MULTISPECIES: SDR family oxidoreductase [unclassified Pseudomonas]PMY40863.1 NAD-dependent dehydratase [Pseudomonas sp. GW456-L14]PMY57993.1 NAD-dependent dehydratase [Pseudomonas sp. GW456-L12]
MESLNKNILLTGVTGFVGGAILRHLCDRPEYSIRVVTRNPAVFPGVVKNSVLLGDLNSTQSWGDALKGIDVVVHSAARVHVMNEQAVDPLSEFRKVNVDGTLNLANQAVASGVKRFIFISSVKVNGEETTAGNKYTADGVVHPVDDYGISKSEAEQGLLKISAETGMQVVIIRPVLVYGPGVKANFLNMMKLVGKGFPLPLLSIENKRSFVALDNLVDFVALCIKHPRAANQIFLVSDGDDLSTPELLRKMARALGKKVILLPFPVRLLRAAARLMGKENITDRLCGSLEVDISKNQELLGWTPPLSVDNALLKTAKHYLGNRNS